MSLPRTRRKNLSDLSKKSLERERLADSIERLGEVAMSPCNNCRLENKPCIISSVSTRCGRCARAGISCEKDGLVGPQLSKIFQERSKLKRELEAALDEEERAFEAQQAARAKRKRLERLQLKLKDKELELLGKGMLKLDEEDSSAVSPVLATETSAAFDRYLASLPVEEDFWPSDFGEVAAESLTGS